MESETAVQVGSVRCTMGNTLAADSDSEVRLRVQFERLAHNSEQKRRGMFCVYICMEDRKSGYSRLID